MPRRIGYARVSTDDQKLTIQKDALDKDGWSSCTAHNQVFREPTNKHSQFNTDKILSGVEL